MIYASTLQRNKMSREEELRAREEAVAAKEKELAQKEKQLDAFSAAVKTRKEEWYDRVNLSERQLTLIIRVIYALLGLVALLILLEAFGIFKI